jgi:hypothetical protein
VRLARGLRPRHATRPGRIGERTTCERQQS